MYRGSEQFGDKASVACVTRHAACHQISYKRMCDSCIQTHAHAHTQLSLSNLLHKEWMCNAF